MTRTTANVEGSCSTMGIAIGSRFEAIVASCTSFERKSDAPPYNTRETDVDDCVSSYASLVALDRGKCNRERERERLGESENDLKMHQSGDIGCSTKIYFCPVCTG